MDGETSSASPLLVPADDGASSAGNVSERLGRHSGAQRRVAKKAEWDLFAPLSMSAILALRSRSIRPAVRALSSADYLHKVRG